MAGQASKKRPDNLPSDYVLEDQIGHLVRRVHQRATAIFTAKMAELQLTPTQFAALVKLYDEGAVSQNHLGRLTAMDPATMQGVVTRLLARGLIRREGDPTDRRRTLLKLDPDSGALVQEAIEIGVQISRETLAPLNGAERDRLLELLRKLS